MSLRYLSVCSGIEAATMGAVRDISGHRNGRLVAVQCVGRNAEGRAMWRCVCDCGTERIVQSNNLLRPSGTRSCGCLRRDANKAKTLRDGAWNDGKSYAIAGGSHCYKTRHSWAKAVIRHYGNKCMRCGWDEARCDAHHRDPKAAGGLHTIQNGIVLCPNCHRVHHQKGGNLCAI
jgi:hypothetical protein